MAEWQNSLESLLSCQVCFEDFEKDGNRVPRLLPCSHTLCECCIHQLIQKTRLECPECRTKHEAPREEKTFPQNKYLLVQLGSKLSHTEDVNNLEKSGTCDTHGKDLIFFCREEGCVQPICKSCFTKQHKKHDIVEIEEAKKETLLQEINILQLSLKSKIDQISGVKNKIQRNSQGCIDALKKEMDAIFTQLKNEIEAHENGISQSMDNEISALKVNLTLLEAIQKNMQETEEINCQEVIKNHETMNDIRQNNKDHLTGTRKYKFPVFEAAEMLSVRDMHFDEISITLPELIHKVPPKIKEGNILDKFAISFYRPHPKDGEGTVFTGVCLSTAGGGG